MNFPEFNGTEFCQYLYTLWPSPSCKLDINAAASGLGVSPTTLRRWRSGKQRVPVAIRWDETRKSHIHRLVAPNGVEYSAGEILSWHFQTQRLKLLSRESQAFRKQPSTGTVIDLQVAFDRLSSVQYALNDLADQLKTPEYTKQKKAQV